MSHTDIAEQNLRQAADTAENSNWSTARLIAASVEQAKRGPKSFSPRGEKLGVVEAAKIMGKSDNTIRAYLAAWDAAAKDGHCRKADQLTPADGWRATMPAPELWEKYRNPNSHSTKPKAESVPEPSVAARQMNPAQRSSFVAEAIAEDPSVAAAATSALAKRHEQSDTAARIARADEQDEADEKADSSGQFVHIIAEMSKAKLASREANRVWRETSFTDEQKKLIKETAELLKTEVAALIAETVGVDWDAELSRIAGGEQ